VVQDALSAHPALARGGVPTGSGGQGLVLRFPVETIRISAVFWVGAAILFGATNLTTSVATGLAVMPTILLGGVTTCSLHYLMTERSIRPVTALALAGQVPADPRTFGI
jgi:adenylate cyclase